MFLRMHTQPSRRFIKKSVKFLISLVSMYDLFFDIRRQTIIHVCKYNIFRIKFVRIAIIFMSECLSIMIAHYCEIYQ